MVKKKYTSKRIKLKDKYKVQRRVVEKHRKDRKTAKRNTKLGVIDHKALLKKKDPGIPNSWPFKQELLQDIERQKGIDAQKKLEAKNAKNKPKNLQELMENSLEKVENFETRQGSATPNVKEKGVNLGQQSRRAFLRDLKKVIESSDVILQILDCRDPISTRLSNKVEETIVSHFNKRLVLVLNKVDLVPKEVVQKWLTYLRQYYPTIAVRAGISSRNGQAIGRSKGDAALENSNNAIGMEGLLQLLKNYARISPKESTKTCITVGVIGYPNVGKSSLLNSLKRTRAVGVSSRPGYTTSIQEVVLDKNIRLLDSPGVVLDSEESKDGTSSDVLLRNCIDIESMEDPIPAVQSLLSRCDYNSLLMTYAIPAFPKDNYEMFLAMIAKKYNKVLKGGIPDKMNAARTVLRHWNTGKIPFYTLPPSIENTAPTKENVSIVSKFDKEMELDFMKSIEGQNNQDIDALDCVQFKSDGMKMNDGSGLAKMLVSDDIMEDEEEEEAQEDAAEDSDSDDSMEEEVSNSRRLEQADDFDFKDL